MENKELYKLKKLAKSFNLDFKKNWFKHLWISKKENILLEYLLLCQDPIYEKYGKDAFSRTKQIENFASSNEFKACLNRYGGQMVGKEFFEKYFLSWTKDIENKEIREIYYNLYKKISKKFKNNSKLAILTKSNDKNELRILKSFTLFHEWIHVLAEGNKLEPKDWRYNEGLVTYFQEFSDKSLNQLEEKAEKTNYSFQKQYFIYAIKFREILKQVNNPQERKIKLKEFIKGK